MNDYCKIFKAGATTESLRDIINFIREVEVEKLGKYVT